MLNKNCFDAKSDSSYFTVKNANYEVLGQALIRYFNHKESIRSITAEMTGGGENFKFKDGYPVSSIDLLYFFIAFFSFPFSPKTFLSLFFT